MASSRVSGNVGFTCKNEIKTRWGDSKNEIGFDVHHIYKHIDVKDWKTRPIMVEKCQNLRNEIKARWGDSVNLLYWGHRTNKSRRSCIFYVQAYLGKIPILTNIFQMGWFNLQLVFHV